MIKVLSTKPLRKEHEQMLEAKNVHLEIDTFIQIDFESDIILPLESQNVQAIFTSINAIKALESKQMILPTFEKIFCISGQTSIAAQKYFGAHIEMITAPNASELLPKIIAQNSGQILWFFCGDIVLETIPNGLKHANIAYEQIVVYKTNLQPHKISSEYNALLFFSPSAVTSFVKDNVIQENTITFAVGFTTAKALQPYSKHIIVAKEASEKGVITAVLEHYNL